MLYTAFRTHPLSYSEVCDTFGAADCAAARTDLGRESFVSLEIFGSVPEGFVAELRSKLRPACNENGLRHAGPGESRGVHVADYDKLVFTHEPGGQSVQKMLAGMGDLGVDGSGPQFSSRPLSASQPLSIPGQMSRIGDLLARRECGQILQAKIDSDFAGTVSECRPSSRDDP